MTLALKTLTYGAMHLTVAVAVTYVLTRDWRLALAVGLIEPMIQTVAFNVHERLWKRAEARSPNAAKAVQALVSTEPPASSPLAA